MNGWFPRINSEQVIASGNDDIWLTDSNGSRIVGKGTTPIWERNVLIYNTYNGTTIVGGELLGHAYNQYEGSDQARWAGVDLSSSGRVDIYSDLVKLDSIEGACNARFGPNSIAWLYPYQTNPIYYRKIVIDYNDYISGIITDFQISPLDGLIVWQTATGTYTREIWTKEYGKVSIRDDETPLKVFEMGSEYWIFSNTGIGAFVRPLTSPFGYWIQGDLYYPDGRMIGDKYRIVGSYGNGTPRFDIWIDFNVPRVDLRTVGNTIPPDPEPEPPDPEPEPPKPDPPSNKFGKIKELIWK